NVCVMGAVELVILALFGLFFDVDLARALPGLAVVLPLGTLGLGAVGTLFAAVTAQVRARELLFPVLLLPAQVPLPPPTRSPHQGPPPGQPLGDASAWLQLLAGADLVYLVIGLLTFEFVL